MDKLTMILAGITDPQQQEALERADREGTIFHCPDLAPVDDADGDPLIVGQVYRKPNGKLFRPTRWQFGSGNFMDTYYHVWGIGDDLKDDRITIDARHGRNDSQIHTYYPSQLQKTFALNELQDEQIKLEILRRRQLKAK